MAQLAIKGHTSRGKEVIEILKMLGGKNSFYFDGTCKELIYIIDSELELDVLNINYPNVKNYYNVFTLEEFLEKFPYKVGDKVHHIIDNENQIITDLIWDGDEDEVLYKTTNNFGYVYVNYLQPYKEETMEEKGTLVKIDLTREMCVADEVEVILGDYEFVLKDGKTYFVKKKPQYPKTYEECAQILLERASVRNDIGYKGDLLVTLQRLLICRDAYWKIAGDWKPNWEENDGGYRYCIRNQSNKIVLSNEWLGENYILSFPTEEIRNMFYENFKDLIEQCKELL